MLKAKKGCGIYRDTLQREARDRYLQKMGFINGLDPYEVESKEWCVGEEFLPPFAREDVFSYLVCGVSAYTHEEFRCYKSLEAYKQLTDGKVHDMEVIKPNENTVIRAKFWMQTNRPLVEVVRLGLVSYQEGLRLQQVFVNRHRSGPAHALLLCQHTPVYTTGIRHKPYPGPLLEKLCLLGADVHRTNRGGLITFHGPGQLVCYPVLNLGSFRKSVRWYVGQLEKTVITLCSRLGVEAATSPHTGVWVGDNKICAIGIHCGRYITSHGLALNCNTDLSWFSHIVPCGIEGKGVTSLSRELQRDVSVEETIPHLLDAFAEHFLCQLTEGERPEPEQNSGVSST